jgi:hypothetical protein
MSGERFAEPSLDPLLRRRQRGDVEYELGQRVEPRIVGAPSSSNGTLAGPGDRDRLSAAPLSNPPPHPRRSTAAGLRIRSLPYLALIGLVGVGITGAFFGTGFWLLKPPAKETGVGSNARDQSSSAAPEPLTPNSVAIPRLPGSSAAQSAAGPDATPTPSSVPPSPEPPAQTATDPQPLAAPDVLSPPAIVPPHGEKRRPTAEGQRHLSRTASRRAHLRSAPQPAQRSSFDQLLTQLTGQTEPAAPSLTPPKGEQPDPFAQPVQSK